MSLNELGKQAYEIAKEHGFYDNKPSVPERLCLIHSEVSEALEDYRDDKMQMAYQDVGYGNKPIGFPSELADVLIRIVDLAAHLNIDLDEAVRIKMEFNKTRPHKHGRKII